MAYLEPTRLRCPACGFSARIEILVGVGPGSRKGDIPSRSFMDPSPFVEGRTEDGGRGLLCPVDGALVWAVQPARPAYGPLTRREMQGRAGHVWLVPGSENPFPREFAEYRPGDPFTAPPPGKED